MSVVIVQLYLFSISFDHVLSKFLYLKIDFRKKLIRKQYFTVPCQQIDFIFVSLFTVIFGN